MNPWVRRVLFALFVRPVVQLAIGLNVRGRERLPLRGPAIVVANHNSHLDAFTMMTLFPGRALHRVRPVAAADYFGGGWKRWLATRLLNAVLVNRSPKPSDGDPLAPIADALHDGEIVVLFPEGTRGEPEVLGPLQGGVAHLSKRFPEVPVVPVAMRGLGEALPKGEAVLVPVFCDVVVGESWTWPGKKSVFLETLRQRMAAVVTEAATVNRAAEPSSEKTR